MTETDVMISVYKSEDGDYDIYVRDVNTPGGDTLVTLRVDARKLDLLASLFRFIQTQPHGACVSVEAEAYDID
jgi:hypothetical protein